MMRLEETIESENPVLVDQLVSLAFSNIEKDELLPRLFEHTASAILCMKKEEFLFPELFKEVVNRVVPQERLLAVRELRQHIGYAAITFSANAANGERGWAEWLKMRQRTERPSFIAQAHAYICGVAPSINPLAKKSIAVTKKYMKLLLWLLNRILLGTGSAERVAFLPVDMAEHDDDLPAPSTSVDNLDPLPPTLQFVLSAKPPSSSNRAVSEEHGDEQAEQEPMSLDVVVVEPDSQSVRLSEDSDAREQGAPIPEPGPPSSEHEAMEVNDVEDEPESQPIPLPESSEAREQGAPGPDEALLSTAVIVKRGRGRPRKKIRAPPVRRAPPAPSRVVAPSRAATSSRPSVPTNGIASRLRSKDGGRMKTRSQK